MIYHNVFYYILLSIFILFHIGGALAQDQDKKSNNTKKGFIFSLLSIVIGLICLALSIYMVFEKFFPFGYKGITTLVFAIIFAFYTGIKGIITERKK